MSKSWFRSLWRSTARPLRRSLESLFQDVLDSEQHRPGGENCSSLACRLLSPYEIFFSQNHIRSEFQDLLRVVFCCSKRAELIQDGRALDFAIESIS